MIQIIVRTLNTEVNFVKLWAIRECWDPGSVPRLWQRRYTRNYQVPSWVRTVGVPPIRENRECLGGVLRTPATSVLRRAERSLQWQM